MMKKIGIVTVLLTLFCVPAAFAYWGSYTAMDIATVKSQGRDDQHIVMTGKLVEHLHRDYYMFEDENGGRIAVEMDDHDRRNVRLNEAVKIYGEIEIKHGDIEIEVDRLEYL